MSLVDLLEIVHPDLVMSTRGTAKINLDQQRRITSQYFDFILLHVHVEINGNDVNAHTKEAVYNLCVSSVSVIQ